MLDHERRPIGPGAELFKFKDFWGARAASLLALAASGASATSSNGPSAHTVRFAGVGSQLIDLPRPQGRALSLASKVLVTELLA